MKRFVTGGARFVGSQFIRDWVKRFPRIRSSISTNLLMLAT